MDLDDPCGERFVYRHLVECGETRRRPSGRLVPRVVSEAFFG